MICPACDYELLVGHDHCENCGAPAYLALALQSLEFTHCTYCGARDETGSHLCLTCGLKKSFKADETVIGTCRNCGLTWRNVWLYCQTCGVARENGLVNTTMPSAESFQPLGSIDRSIDQSYSFISVESASASREVSFASHDYAPTATSNARALLSEAEVVERMFANGGYDSAVKGERGPSNFFAQEEEDEESESARLSQANSTTNILAPSAVSPVVIYDLSDFSEPEAASVQTHSSSATTAPPFATSASNSPASAAVTAQVMQPEPRQAEVPADPVSARSTATPAASATSPMNAAQPPTGPVQTVRFINKPHAITATHADKTLVKVTAVLIFLILIFSALIVSGFRIRDLFSQAPPQASPQVEASPVAAPTQPNQIPPAPAEMAYIPGGVFRMGADAGDSFESPAHNVTVTPFFMDRTEVTNAQYAEFIKATNHPSPPAWKSGKYEQGMEKFPVVSVSWQDANDYANWAGKRLPTEAEWEFAARAQDTRRYPWGSNWDATKANTNESGLNRPVEVGSYPAAANPLGLLDLAGNIWEWTAGEVISYKDSSLILAPGKVIRGGAFYAPKERATTTFRGFAPPDKQAVGIGFRCVKDVK